MRLPGLVFAVTVLLTLAACHHTTPVRVEKEILDHFKCYAVEGEVPPHDVLTLRDQFHIEEGVKLVEMKYFCNPVTKIIRGEERPAGPDEDHLTCYRLQPEDKFNAMVEIRNQFGSNRFRNVKSELLCVPTNKRSFEELPPNSGDCPGGENCCCNMPDGAGGNWPDCDAGFECRRQVNTTNPNDAIQVCVRQGTPPNAPLQLNSSQPPFCRR